MTTQVTLKSQIVALLKGENAQHVETYASYCQGLLVAKKKDGTVQYPFMATKTAEMCAKGFLKVKEQGLVFDGKHITWQSTGISHDYIAYKNKMLLVYPETKFDMEVVKEGDTFNVDKVDGDITYRHIIKDPLVTADFKNITGAYCIVRNARGVFLTTLSKEDIAKHRKVAKTDTIWIAWFKEMVLKTVLKKAFKYHFDDIIAGVDEMDNENIDLDNLDEEDDTRFENEKKRIIEVIKTKTTVVDLNAYYKTLPNEFSKDGDIIEECKAQKVVCQNTK